MNTFQPHNRQAVLLNSYDHTGGNYSREERMYKGNKKVFEMEFLTSGKISSVTVPWLTDEIINFEGGGGLPGFLTLGDCREGSFPEKRRKLLYNRVDALFADDPRSCFDNSLDRAQTNSSNDTLTLFYATSHGLEGKLLLNGSGETIEYSTFLDRMSDIKGKKVIYLGACFSGSIMQALMQRSDCEDFSVITSTGSTQLGVNWNDGSAHDSLFTGMQLAEPLTQISERVLATQMGQLTMGQNGEETQQPQALINFEVVI